MVFSALHLFSQLQKGNTIIAIEGNYIKANTQSGVTTNISYTQGKYLNGGISAGYFITGKFVAGLGLDYTWNKETRYNTLYFNNFYQQEQLSTKAHVILPNVYLAYYYQVVNKLYVSAGLKLNYGKIKSEYNTIYAGSGPFSDPSGTNPAINLPYVKGASGNSETDYFSATVSPELMYFASRRIGLSLNLGGITYAMNDWKTDNSNVIFCFKPDYWKFGIKFKL